MRAAKLHTEPGEYFVVGRTKPSLVVMAVANPIDGFVISDVSAHPCQGPVYASDITSAARGRHKAAHGDLTLIKTFCFAADIAVTLLSKLFYANS